jgi:hypothetical protein
MDEKLYPIARAVALGYRPVLSVICLQVRNETSTLGDIQVVVRDSRTNKDHPNVISTATLRIPGTLFLSMLSEAEFVANQGSTLIVRSVDWLNGPLAGEIATVHAVQALLSQKLGVANALELGELVFAASLCSAAIRCSLTPEGGSRGNEAGILMLTVAVRILKGAKSFPGRTASYSHIRWVPVESFLAAVESKDPSRIDLDPVEFCFRGLCISSAYDTVGFQVGAESFACVSDGHLGL